MGYKESIMSSNITPVEIGFVTPKFPDTNITGNRMAIVFWVSLLAVVNFSLVFGNHPAINMMFRPDAIADGEWWRIFLSPLVHVSPYHLLMDGSAFLLVYIGLEEHRWSRRLVLTLFSAAGSLLLPLFIAPELNRIGLCGLSGAAHGLTAVSSLEMSRHRGQKKIGCFLLVVLSLKVAWELWSGTVFLHFLHFGDIGHPIVATHAGGVLGGVVGYVVIAVLPRAFWDKQ